MFRPFRCVWWIWLLLPMQVWATGESPKFLPSYYETMIFRNESHPTSAYTGLLLRGMAQDKPTVILGDSIAAGKDISLQVGSASGLYQTDVRSILFKVDVSALPDSAVVIDAFLVLSVYASVADSMSVVTALTGWCSIWRVLQDWDGTACWNYYAGTTAWGAAGCLTVTGTWTNAYGGTASPVLRTMGLHEDIPQTWFAVRVAASIDSLLDGSGFSSAPDCLQMAMFDVRVPPRTSIDADACAFRVNITEAVQHWHNGSWENNGIKLDDFTHNEYSFGRSFPFCTQYNTVGAKYDPFVVVRYLYATPGGGQRRGASLGPTP